MNPVRIGDLLAPFLENAGGQPLSPDVYLAISMYIDLLLRWNARVNLTAVRDPEEIVTRHFGESIFAAQKLLPLPPPSGQNSSRLRVADLGTGAGFPGIPLKLWDPQISLTLIESNHKKAAFLREVGRGLTLTDINVLNVRAQDLPGSQNFDIVTLRAVERFDEILPTASNLVTPAGRIGLLIGVNQVERSKRLGQFEWRTPIPVPQSRSRVVLVGQRHPSGEPRM